MSEHKNNDYINFDDIPAFLPYLSDRAKIREKVLQMGQPCVGSIEDCQKKQGVTNCDDCPIYKFYKESESSLKNTLKECVARIRRKE